MNKQGGVQNMVNRRKTDRAAANLSVILKPKNKKQVEAFVYNVSETGMYVETDEIMFQQTVVLVYLPLEIGEKKNLCMVTGHVVRVNQDRNRGQRGYGVRFESTMTRSTREALSDYVDNKLDRPKSFNSIIEPESASLSPLKSTERDAISRVPFKSRGFGKFPSESIIERRRKRIRAQNYKNSAVVGVLVLLAIIGFFSL